MDRKGIEVSVMGWLILGLITLIVVILIIMAFNGKVSPQLDRIMALFQFA